MIADRVEIVGADMEVTIASTGDETSKQFRVFALKQVTDGDEPAVGKERSSTITDGQSVQPISMWHDVPLHPESFVVNMICEVSDQRTHSISDNRHFVILIHLVLSHRV